MALWGNTMALFLSETLLDAIAEIGSGSKTRESLLRHIEFEENVEYQKLSKSDLPDPEGSFLTQIGDELFEETVVSVFFRSPSICHTARLPAETRYLGILTETDKVGVDGYYKGIPKNVAELLKGGDDSAVSMPLDQIRLSFSWTWHSQNREKKSGKRWWICFSHTVVSFAILQWKHKRILVAFKTKIYVACGAN
jgi:hypothetical protein